MKEANKQTKQDKVNGYTRQGESALGERRSSGGEGGLGQIKISDSIPGAEYANAMQINHTKDEFQMMFLNLFGQSGKVTGKVITAPGNLKRMLVAMTENLKKYEEKFGTIEESKINEKEIGFKG